MSHRRPADPRNVPSPPRPGLLSPPPPPPAGLAPAAALALGTALVLGAAGEAAAQTGVCAGDPPPANTRIVCSLSSITNDITINARSVSISATDPAIVAHAQGGAGNIVVNLGQGLNVMTTGGFAHHGSTNRHDGAGSITVTMEAGASISTAGQYSYGIHRDATGSSGSGGFTLDMRGGSIMTSGGNASAVNLQNFNAAGITAHMKGGTVSATGGVDSDGFFLYSTGSGRTDMTLSGGSIEVSSTSGGGIYFLDTSASSGDASIRMTGGKITTSAANSHGAFVRVANAANASIDLSDDIVVSTSGDVSYGAMAAHRGGTSGLTEVAMSGGSVSTSGTDSFGLYGLRFRNGGPGRVSLSLSGGSVSTTGDYAHGLYGHQRVEGDVSVVVSGGSVEASGNSMGALASHDGTSGTVELRTGAEAEVKAPFAIGAQARSTNVMNAGGRVSVRHEGTLEARDAGLLAWVARVSRENAAAETEPMIRIVSSGDVRVGASVADAFIRNRIAGDDGTLSAGEEAVFNAITADDSDALTTALEALPADYDADWKAEARNLLRKRGYTTAQAAVTRAAYTVLAGDDGRLSRAELAVLKAIQAEDATALTTALTSFTPAYQAQAREMLRLRIFKTGNPDAPVGDTIFSVVPDAARAGILAVGTSHANLISTIRQGDVDATLASVATPTTQQQETLAAQRAISPLERRVIDAVLAADLDAVNAALMDLPAAYTNEWKAQVREFAGSHSAGDIRVEATGGTISAEGDGIQARYLIRHDGNGAISVRVSEGASVTGGVNGIYVGGAGLDDDGLRDQTVTVNGAVMGGTGAGVHLAGGGTVTVGRTGRVGAASGDGVLSDGAGDLAATVAGTVEGHVRAQGGGDLSVTVEREGEITGDVRAEGGGDLSATVAGTVKGDLRAMDGGDLDATISGTVEGDLRAVGGGVLTADVQEGGTVTGTVHDPAGPLTVAGSIGRLLYASGGTVTVAATGRLTGVEVEGRREAVRSEAGDLDVTVAGTVAGDLRAPTGGALTLDVQEGGTVTGTVHDPAGPLTVAGSIGRLLYTKGGTVTVSGTGRLTGVEGETEAIRSEAGDLSVTVAGKGRVNGDLRAMGGGALTVDVKEGGAVTGTVHDPAGPFTVTGSIGRLLYTNGGTVTVSGTGRLTGVEGETEAIRSEAGDLAVTVAEMGTVTGDVRGMGAGGLSAMVAGTVTGDVVEEGAGDLDATISGTVEGNVFGRGTGEHTVTVSNGGTVRGTIHLAASPVTVHGTAGRVRFDEGGTVTVGGTGRITGIEVEGGREAIRSEAGDLKVTLHERVGETGPQAIKRIDGTIRNDPKGSLEFCYVPAGGGEECASGPAPTVPQGAWDVGLRPEGGGVYQVESDYAPRSRLYEALPSVLLGLNAPARYEERMAAARAEQGGWARVETVRGKWKADASTSQKLSRSGVELEYDHRRHGLQAGMDVAAGEDGLFGVSLHHRRGSADVSKGGKVELSGHGVGVSAAWGKGGVYVDVQAEATQYEADFRSSRHGVLKQDVSGHGYALGVEAGRRFALDGARAGMVLTPRAGLVHSRVSVGDFTDAVGTRVSLEDGGSLKGRAGMVVEVKPHGGRGETGCSARWTWSASSRRTGRSGCRGRS